MRARAALIIAPHRSAIVGPTRCRPQEKELIELFKASKAFPASSILPGQNLHGIYTLKWKLSRIVRSAWTAVLQSKEKERRMIQLLGLVSDILFGIVIIIVAIVLLWVAAYTVTHGVLTSFIRFNKLF